MTTKPENPLEQAADYAYDTILERAEKDLNSPMIAAIACGIACSTLNVSREQTHDLIDWIWDMIDKWGEDKSEATH